MDYETFKTELLEVLQRAAGEKKEVSLHQIEKNNGVLLDGIITVSYTHLTLPTKA